MGTLRPADELWDRRRARYLGWLGELPASAIFAAREDGDAVGYAMVRAYPSWGVRRTGNPVGDLETLTVLPGAPDGTTAALLAAAEDHLRGQGAEEATAAVLSADTEGLDRYGAAGFRPFTTTWWAAPVPDLGEPSVPLRVVPETAVDDLEDLHTVLLHHHRDVGPPYLPEQRSDHEAWSAVRDEHLVPGAILLRTDGGYALGTVGETSDVWDTGRVGHVAALVVDASARGTGEGAALFAGVMQGLREGGADAVELEVLDGNTGAQAFYARHGMRRAFDCLYKRL